MPRDLYQALLLQRFEDQMEQIQLLGKMREHLNELEDLRQRLQSLDLRLMEITQSLEEVYDVDPESNPNIGDRQPWQVEE